MKVTELGTALLEYAEANDQPLDNDAITSEHADKTLALAQTEILRCFGQGLSSSDLIRRFGPYILPKDVLSRYLEAANIVDEFDDLLMEMYPWGP